MSEDFIVQTIELKTPWKLLKDKTPMEYSKEFLSKWVKDLPDEHFTNLFNVEVSIETINKKNFLISKFKFSNNLAE